MLRGDEAMLRQLHRLPTSCSRVAVGAARQVRGHGRSVVGAAAALRTPGERLPLPAPPTDGLDVERAACTPSVHRLLDAERQQRRAALTTARNRRRDDAHPGRRDAWNAAHPERGSVAARRRHQEASGNRGPVCMVGHAARRMRIQMVVQTFVQ